MIQKRTTTLLSGHPNRSKWWWIGAILKSPSTGAALPGRVAEVSDLEDYREHLQDEDTPHDRQEKLRLEQNGHDRYGASQSERTRVAHEDLCGMRVEPKESEAATGQAERKHRQLPLRRAGRRGPDTRNCLRGPGDTRRPRTWTWAIAIRPAASPSSPSVRFTAFAVPEMTNPTNST